MTNSSKKPYGNKTLLSNGLGGGELYSSKKPYGNKTGMSVDVEQLFGPMSRKSTN